MSLLSDTVYAASKSENVVNTIVPKIVANIVVPLVEFIFALAFLYFVWGLIVFFKNGDDPAKRKEGQSHILWGVVGITIMISVYGIVRLVMNTVGQPGLFGI